MEAAPLTEAHVHVRKAAALAGQSDIKASQEHHKQAALAFAKARETTKDPEATRMLRLLEEHHLSWSLPAPDPSVSTKKADDSSSSTLLDRDRSPSKTSRPTSKPTPTVATRSESSQVSGRAGGSQSRQSKSILKSRPGGGSGPQSASSTTSGSKPSADLGRDKEFDEFYRAFQNSDMPTSLRLAQYFDNGPSRTKKGMASPSHPGSAGTGFGSRPPPGSESFILVPTSGHTESYAAITRKNMPAKSGLSKVDEHPLESGDGDESSSADGSMAGPTRRHPRPGESRSSVLRTSVDRSDGCGYVKSKSMVVGTSSFGRDRRTCNQCDVEIQLLRRAVHELESDNAALRAKLAEEKKSMCVKQAELDELVGWKKGLEEKVKKMIQDKKRSKEQAARE